MTNNFLSIIIKAIKIRMDRGESFDEAIASYTKLSEEDISRLKQKFNIEEG